MGDIKIKQCVVGAMMTNTYLLKNPDLDELLIVDPSSEPDTLADHISEFGGSVKAILLTHGHFDHIMAVNELKEKYGIKVYAHEKERPILTDSGLNMSASIRRPYSVEADVYLKDLEHITLAGYDIEVIHTPGHTPGSCCYYIASEGVLISGDTLFYCSVGRTDFPAGSMSDMNTSIQRLLNTLPPETKVYTGHERNTTIDYEKRYNPFA